MEGVLYCVLLVFCPILVERNGSTGAAEGVRLRMPLDPSINEEKCQGSNTPCSHQQVLSHDAPEKCENMLTEGQQERKPCLRN